MAVKDDLRTQKAAFWWRWWDEAEHKSTPEKRLAFYDALMRYIFRGDIPPDPTEMDDPTGIDYAAYDATHYFEVIDSMIGIGTSKKRGGQPGNMNARKKRIGNESETNKKRIKNESENEYQNESKTNIPKVANNDESDGKKCNLSKTNKTNKTNPLRMKNEERRMKNEEERVRERDALSLSLSRSDDPPGGSVEAPAGNTPPTVEDVLKVAKDAAHRSGCEEIPEDFARDWYALMVTSGWRDTKGASVLPHGWRGKLAFAWRDEKRRRATGAGGWGRRGGATGQPIGVILRDEGYDYSKFGELGEA